MVVLGVNWYKHKSLSFLHNIQYSDKEKTLFKKKILEKKCFCICMIFKVEGRV